MCMWNGEWKSSQPREGKYLWMIIDFSSSFHVSLAGTHASPTFINFIHRTIWCVPTLSLFHIDRNISRPTIKKILLHRTLRTPRNRKPIIDGIINVINLHNQYLFYQDTFWSTSHHPRRCQVVKDDFCLRTMFHPHPTLPRALFVDGKYSRKKDGKVDINNNAARVPFPSAHEVPIS